MVTPQQKEYYKSKRDLCAQIIEAAKEVVELRRKKHDHKRKGTDDPGHFADGSGLRYSSLPGARRGGKR